MSGRYESEYRRQYGKSCGRIQSSDCYAPMAGLCSSYLGFGREPDLQRRRRFDAGALARSYASIYRSSDPQHHPYQATAPRTTWPSTRHYDHDQSYARYATTNGTKAFAPTEELASPEHETTTRAEQAAEPEVPPMEGPPAEPQRPRSEREAAEIGSTRKLTTTTSLAPPYPAHPVSQSETSRPPLAAAPPFDAQQFITQNALSCRAALKSPPQRPAVQKNKTEYLKQFSWKKPASPTPIQVAEQSLYSGVRSALPFQQKPVSMDTEYRCSYQYIEPPPGPRLRKHVEQCAPIFNMYRTKKKEKKLGPSGDGPSSPSPPQPEPSKTEYATSYYVPEGAGRTRIPQASDLRQQAWSYRMRSWGTHFSRQHLGQLHSQNTIHWEDNEDDYPSTQYLTVEPCQQREGHRVACVEPLDLPSHSAFSTKRSSGPPTEIQQAWEIEKRRQEEEEQEENGHLRDDRLQTPELMARTSQRTHHDLTTPVDGGAMLVRKLPSSSTAAEASARRKEAWTNNPHYPPPADHRSISKPARVRYTPPPPDLRPPVHGIQGMLAKPDFLHNGDLSHAVRHCQFMGKDGDCEQDQHFSMMSWRSAASCSAASAILERAQKRREDFWGKR